MLLIQSTCRTCVPGTDLSCILLCLTGCDRPELMPWHTELLESEFSTEDARDINSFEDYLALEDAVFAELEQRIYADSDTGPAACHGALQQGQSRGPGSTATQLESQF